MRQFNRVYKLEIGNKYQSIKIDNLAVSFSIEKTITSEPNAAKIEIYNLNKNNRNLLADGIFKFVRLEAGYNEAGLIYEGEIATAYTVRNDLDFISVLECGDGQSDYTKAQVYTTLKSGVKDSEIVNLCLKNMSSKGGAIDLPKDRALPRCKVLAGDVKDYITQVARNNDADWHILDGRVNVLPRDKILNNNEGFILSENTGLIGAPQKTDDGLKLQCLLNPRLNIGSLVRVESIMQEYSGDYKIVKITHNGDFTGDMWQSEIIATGGKFIKVQR
ncbi:hypothetical protein KDE12_01210 [Campylobacter sp. faydin G-105]|uniref:phage protein n=1 Tax=Campylobacter anatolicus TaxID=2829105 RepID=UPI001B8DF7FC|nr:hypothetical protein [Campylobacter anatolicus]MBR8461470.1 hypothetical protein [Campylobacter anatolicus]